jgi:uncharacterized protein
VIVPEAVVEELAIGQAHGVPLPDLRAVEWIVVRRPVSAAALPLVVDLGPGETQVLALALESHDAIIVVDDDLARRTHVPPY